VQDTLPYQARHSFQKLIEYFERSFFSERTADPDGTFQGPSVAKFCHNMAVLVILDDFDPFEDVRVVDCHDGHLLHIEKVLSDFVVDGLEVNDLDCHWRLVCDVFS
jgi:hypothetical protein